MRRAVSIASRTRLPLSFEENASQTDPAVKFLARGDEYTVFLTRNQAVVSLRRSLIRAPSDGALQLLNPTSAVLKIGLIGANVTPEIATGQVQPGYSNYFIGNDRSRWIHNVKRSSRC